MAGILLVVGLSLSGSPRVKTALDSKIITYLQKKQVPGILKQKLDTYFSSSMIQILVANLYNASTPEGAQNAAKELKKHGFVFVSSGKYHVFTHTLFPGYVFKMALPFINRTETLNAGRIKYAERLRALIQQKKLKIKIPKKWAYFIPKKANLKTKLPQLLVVAQKMNLAGAKPTLNSFLRKQIKVLEDEADYIDVHDDNVMQCGDYAIIVDTEQHTDETIAALFEDSTKEQEQPEAADAFGPFEQLFHKAADPLQGWFNDWVPVVYSK